MLNRFNNEIQKFYEIIKKRNAKYPFPIFNTDKENQPGVHWWSFMDINPKNNLFLFYSFGIKGFKLFIVDNDQDIVNELLYNFRKCESKSGQKLELCTMKFCVETWQKMSHKRKDQQTGIAQSFFHLLEQFSKLKKTHCMNILILENQIQDLTRPNCGQFQLYFYKNLFDPDEKSKIISHRTLNKSTLQTIINEIFSTDIKENDAIKCDDANHSTQVSCYSWSNVSQEIGIRGEKSELSDDGEEPWWESFKSQSTQKSTQESSQMKGFSSQSSSQPSSSQVGGSSSQDDNKKDEEEEKNDDEKISFY